jgi:hypothetical protein
LRTPNLSDSKTYVLSNLSCQDEAQRLRPLCPTRWTVRARSLATVIENYSSLLQFFDEVAESDKTEAGAKASGLLQQCLKFDNFFILRLLYKVFSRAETVSSSIQKVDLDMYHTQLLLNQLKADVASMRDDNEFETFWSDVLQCSHSLELDEPQVSRPRKIPRRLESLDDNPGTQHSHTSVLAMYRQRYFEVIDSLKSGLDDRFPSNVFEHMTNIEKFIIGQTSCDSIMAFYKDDLDADRLTLHRDMFVDIARQRNIVMNSFHDALMVLRGSHSDQEGGNFNLSVLLPEIAKLVCLALTIPVTTCTAERSFSTLRRLKTYLRSTMSQCRLNHVALLHVHKSLCQELDTNAVADEFIRRCSVRRNTFLMQKCDKLP